VQLFNQNLVAGQVVKMEMGVSDDYFYCAYWGNSQSSIIVLLQGEK
jgi:hypothetical protein